MSNKKDLFPSAVTILTEGCDRLQAAFPELPPGGAELLLLEILSQVLIDVAPQDGPTFLAVLSHQMTLGDEFDKELVELVRKRVLQAYAEDTIF